MPYAIFVDCTEMIISPEDREKYLVNSRPPAELEDWCKDLLLLGKREISNLVKWRAKVRDAKFKDKQAIYDKIEYAAHDEEEQDELDPEDELYQIEKKERRAQERLKEKKMLAFAKVSQAGTVKVAATELEAELQDFDFETYGDLMRKGEVYTDFKTEEEVDDERLRKLGGRFHEYKKREMKPNSEEEVMDNLEYLYEMKRKRQASAVEKHKERVYEKEKKKKRFLGEDHNDDEDQERAMKMERLDDKDTFLRKRALDETANRVEVDDLRQSKWFDRDIFDVMGPRKKQVVQDAEDEEDDYADEEEDLEEGDEEGDDEDLEDEEDDEEAMDEEGLEEELDDEEGDEEEDDDEDEEEDEEESEEEAPNKRAAQNGNGKNLKMLHEDGEYEVFGDDVDEDEMLKDLQNSKVTKKDIKRLNRIKGYEQQELEDAGKAKPEPVEEENIDEYDGRHYDPLTINQKKLLKTEDKKEKWRAHKGLDNGIQIVPLKKFEDFDTDELAADLALAKKMIRKKDREEILEMSFNKHNNFDFEGLPSWFVEDEKRHHFLNLPITKEEVREMKEELRTLNEKPAKKVLEARFRKKHKLAKQLRKFKKQADQVFEEEGMDERTKGKEVQKLRHKIVTADKNKNPKKKIIVGKKFKISAPGKKTTGKKYRIVDSRAKKELRAEKRRKRKGKSVSRKGKRY